MALTYSTGMTVINDADSVTNWAAVRFAGAGGAPAAALDTTVFKQGAGAVSAKLAGNNWNSAIVYDWYTSAVGKTGNTTVNMSTTGNEVIKMWVNNTTPSISLTISAGGMYVIVSSSADTGTTAPTVYSEWYVYGSATYPGGWQLIMVDTRKTPSATVGGGCNLAAVRRVGFGNRNVAAIGTVKSDNVFVDYFTYGRPRYQVIGDGSTTATWALMQADSASSVNGLIENIGGAYQISCGLRIGSGSQGATTTFTDATGTLFLLKRYTYYSGGTVDALNYADYYVFDANGASGFKTAITIGSVVGTGDNRQGVLGGGIRSPDTTNVTWSADFSTNSANLSAVKLYGFSWIGAKGGILFDNNSGATLTSIISNTFVNCGEINPGTTGNGAEILSCSVIDPNGGTSANRGLRFPKADPHNTKNISLITSGTPTTQHLVHLSAAGTYTTTFDNVKVFGDYSSGTLWHGEASANNAGTITIAATNGSNETGAEIEKTGTPPQVISIVSNPVTLSIHVQDIDTAASIVGARVYVPVTSTASGRPFNQTINTITRSGSTATVTFAADHNLATNDYLKISGCDQSEYNNAFQVTYTGPTTLTVTVSGTPASGSGTMVGTWIIINSVTDGSGNISATYTYAESQPVNGWVRFASGGGPYYKTGPISGTVSNTTGLSVTVQLIPDS